MKKFVFNNRPFIPALGGRAFILSVAFVFDCLLSYSQNDVRKVPPPTYLEKSKMECIYHHVEVDTVLEEVQQHYMLLQVGDDYTTFISLCDYLRDSVYISRGNTTEEGLSTELVNKFPRTTHESVLRHNDDFTVRNNFFMNYAEYNDSAFKINWEMHPDTMTVCGYLCHKATARIRGVDWTAWYAEDIPIDAGPWKFHGLPGMILKVTNAENTHDYEAVTIRKPNFEYVRTRYRWRNVPRAKYLEMERGNAFGTLQPGFPGMPYARYANKRRFYSPRENE